MPANPSMQLQSLPWFTLTQAAFGAHGFRTSHGWRQRPSKQISAKEQSSFCVHWTVVVRVFVCLCCLHWTWGRVWFKNLFGASVKKKNKTIYAIGDIYNIISCMVHGVEWWFLCHFFFWYVEIKKQVNNCTPCWCFERWKPK